MSRFFSHKKQHPDFRSHLIHKLTKLVQAYHDHISDFITWHEKGPVAEFNLASKYNQLTVKLPYLSRDAATIKNDDLQMTIQRLPRTWCRLLGPNLSETAPSDEEDAFLSSVVEIAYNTQYCHLDENTPDNCVNRLISNLAQRLNDLYSTIAQQLNSSDHCRLAEFIVKLVHHTFDQLSEDNLAKLLQFQDAERYQQALTIFIEQMSAVAPSLHSKDTVNYNTQRTSLNSLIIDTRASLSNSQRL